MDAEYRQKPWAAEAVKSNVPSWPAASSFQRRAAFCNKGTTDDGTHRSRARVTPAPVSMGRCGHERHCHYNGGSKLQQCRRCPFSKGEQHSERKLPTVLGKVKYTHASRQSIGRLFIHALVAVQGGLSNFCNAHVGRCCFTGNVQTRVAIPFVSVVSGSAALVARLSSLRDMSFCGFMPFHVCTS